MQGNYSQNSGLEKANPGEGENLIPKQNKKGGGGPQTSNLIVQLKN
jgi:hypothetical protein